METDYQRLQRVERELKVAMEKVPINVYLFADSTVARLMAERDEIIARGYKVDKRD